MPLDKNKEMCYNYSWLNIFVKPTIIQIRKNRRILVKVKLFRVINSKDAINKMGEISSYDAKTAYQIARNIREIGSEFESFEKIRGDLITKYGSEIEDGMIQVDKKNIEVFNKELNDVLDVEVDLNIIMINPEKLPNTSPFDLVAIDWMLELEEAAEKES